MLAWGSKHPMWFLGIKHLLDRLTNTALVPICFSAHPCTSLFGAGTHIRPGPRRLNWTVAWTLSPCPGIQGRASVLPVGPWWCLPGGHPKQLRGSAPIRAVSRGIRATSLLSPEPHYPSQSTALFIPWPRPLSLVPGSSHILVCLPLFLSPCPLPHLALPVPLPAERPSTGHVRSWPACACHCFMAPCWGPCVQSEFLSPAPAPGGAPWAGAGVGVGGQDCISMAWAQQVLRQFIE